MKITKENYPLFKNALRKASQIAFHFQAAREIGKASFAAPAIVAVTLSWHCDGVESTFVGEWDSKIYYIRDNAPDVGIVSYIFTSSAYQYAYLFDGLSRDGNIFFTATFSGGSDVTTEIAANIDNGKKFYGNVPVYYYHNSFDARLRACPRTNTGYIRTATRYSHTTSKHINQWLNGVTVIDALLG